MGGAPQMASENAGGRLERIISAISHLLAGLGAVGLVMMMLHVVADVLSRYIFNAPVVGTLEIVSSYYMVMVVFLPFAATQLRGANIFVSLFTGGLSDRVIYIIDGVIRLIFAIAILVFVWVTVEVALEKTRMGEKITSVYTQIPIWPTRWLPPIGGAALFACLCLQAVSSFRRGSARSGAAE